MSDLAETTDIAQEAPENESYEKFLIFSIQGKLYSFPSHLISEIAHFDKVFPLPLMPPYALGIVNRYSTPYALFDTGLLFNKTPSLRKKMLLFKEEIDRVAFLIDDVTNIAGINPENIISIDRTSDTRELTDAVEASFDWNNNNVFVLNIHHILDRITGETVL